MKRLCLLCGRNAPLAEMAAHDGTEYVAWLCEKCGPRYKEFAGEVIRRFGHGGARIVPPPNGLTARTERAKMGDGHAGPAAAG